MGSVGLPSLPSTVAEVNRGRGHAVPSKLPSLLALSASPKMVGRLDGGVQGDSLGADVHPLPCSGRSPDCGLDIRSTHEWDHRVLVRSYRQLYEVNSSSVLPCAALEVCHLMAIDER